MLFTNIEHFFHQPSTLNSQAPSTVFPHSFPSRHRYLIQPHAAQSITPCFPAPRRSVRPSAAAAAARILATSKWNVSTTSFRLLPCSSTISTIYEPRYGTTKPNRIAFRHTFLGPKQEAQHQAHRARLATSHRLSRPRTRATRHSHTLHRVQDGLGQRSSD